MITLQYSFSVALSMAMRLLANEKIMYDTEKRWFVEAYQNGREQGIIIWGGAGYPAYFIAQQRNSDDIVIYKGKYSMQSISDDAYSHPNYFRYNAIDEAIDWLEKELTK